MKTTGKRLGALALAVLCGAAFSVPALGAEAPEKGEVVYVNLTPEGEAGTIYVVNSYDLGGDTAVTDYGDYRSVKNLTTTGPLEQSGEAVRFTAPAGKFYYQGELDGGRTADLPWTVSVGYALDGREVPGSELAGASGRLEISVRLRQNPDADPVYRDHYSLQATVSLDTAFCKNITAEGATLAEVGRKKQMSYIVLPGKEKDFAISADVTDFEMDGIQVNGIPLVLDIDDPDTGEIKDQIYDLQDGAARLDDGAVALEEGMDQLEDGVTDLRDGSRDLRDGAAELDQGTRQLAALLEQLDPILSGAVSGVGDPRVSAAYRAFSQGVASLPASAGLLSDGAGQLSDGLDDLLDGVLEAKDGVAQLTDGTLELRDQSSGMDAEVDDKVDGILDEYRSKDFTPVSFVSPRNQNVSSVQFVIKTADIKIPEEKPAAPEEEPEPGFWQRIANLFGRAS